MNIKNIIDIRNKLKINSTFFYKKTDVSIPNLFLRSSIFGIIKKGKRENVKNSLKYTFKNMKIFFTGESFDQSDFDIFLGLIFYLNISKENNICKFSSYKFLKLIGRSCGKNDVLWLENSLLRMQLSFFKIKFINEKFNSFYLGSIIIDWYKNNISSVYLVRLNFYIISIFLNKGWSYINLSNRLNLKKQQLSKWLYNFYSSINSLIPININTLKFLTGSNTKCKRRFKQMLIKSLFKINLIIDWKFKITKDNKIYVIK